MNKGTRVRLTRADKHGIPTGATGAVVFVTAVSYTYGGWGQQQPTLPEGTPLYAVRWDDHDDMFERYPQYIGDMLDEY